MLSNLYGAQLLNTNKKSCLTVSRYKQYQNKYRLLIIVS
jgi:hypothetical protein